jgi:hypothetical protein
MTAQNNWVPADSPAGKCTPPHEKGGSQDGTAVQRALRLPIDENGSPVTLAPADWLVCFVPGLQRQWWHRFVRGFQHVFLIRPTDAGKWLLFEPWWSRLLVSTLTTEQALKFLKWADAGAVLQVRERIPGSGSQLRGWSNCAVLAAFLLGREYHLFSPNTLYKRLAAESEVARIRLPDFLQHHFVQLVSAEADRALGPAEALLEHTSISPRDQLAFIAGRIGIALRSPLLAMAYKVAASEDNLHPGLSDILWQYGTSRAVDCIERALVHVAPELTSAKEGPFDATRTFLDTVRTVYAGPNAGTEAEPSASPKAETERIVDRFFQTMAAAA